MLVEAEAKAELEEDWVEEKEDDDELGVQIPTCGGEIKSHVSGFPRIVGFVTMSC